MSLTRRSFFQRTLGAVVTSTILGKVEVQGKEVDTVHTILEGSSHDKSTYILYKGLDFAAEHDKSRVLIIFPNYDRLVFAADQVNYPHHGDGPQLSFTKHTRTFSLSNGSRVILDIPMNAHQWISSEFNAVYAHEVSKKARERAFSRAPKTPRHLEWS